MPPAKPRPKPFLKLKKTGVGTTVATNKVKTSRRTYVSQSNPKAAERSTSQIKKLKKVGKKNVPIVKNQRYALLDYKKGREPYKPRGLFIETPIAEMKLSSKLGVMVFTKNHLGKPTQYRITRADLLNQNYYREVDLISNILESRRMVSSSPHHYPGASSPEMFAVARKQKAIDVIRFLKLNNLKGAGVSLNQAKKHFSLPEILSLGGFTTPELLEHFTDRDIKRASDLRMKKNYTKLKF